MTNQRAIILLSQMYLPAFDEEEKQAIDKAIEALTAQEPRLVTEADFANADECGYITAWCEASNGLFAECITIRALQETDFRYWTSRPTDEEMEATPWPD